MQQISDEAYDSYLKERGLTRDQYTTMELLAVASAREVTDHAFVFAGTGLPLLASMLAQHTVAPNMTLIMEAGIVGPKVEHLPISVSDPRECLKGSTVSNMPDTFGTTALRGYCTVGMLGGANGACTATLTPPLFVGTCLRAFSIPGLDRLWGLQGCGRRINPPPLPARFFLACP